MVLTGNARAATPVPDKILAFINGDKASTTSPVALYNIDTNSWETVSVASTSGLFGACALNLKFGVLGLGKQLILKFFLLDAQMGHTTTTLQNDISRKCNLETIYEWMGIIKKEFQRPVF
jgi:hypothetical protein